MNSDWIKSYLTKETAIPKSERVAFKIEVSKAYADNFEEFLNYLKRLAGIGHTFNILVDPDDKEHGKRFEIDGDGSEHIISIARE